jgi:hypothetical protein
MIKLQNIPEDLADDEYTVMTHRYLAPVDAFFESVHDAVAMEAFAERRAHLVCLFCGVTFNLHSNPPSYVDCNARNHVHEHKDERVHPVALALLRAGAVDLVWQ